MISALFHSFFYNPIYNALVALVTLIPGGDVGIAVVIVTIGIRLLLLPFSFSAARTQREMKRLEPHLKELKEKHKDDKQQESIETLKLLKEAQVNPFASFAMMFIQVPILLALFWVFRYEPFTSLDSAKLYAFTPLPHVISLHFLGLISVTTPSIVLAILAGATQYYQAQMALKGTLKPSDTKSAQNDFQRVMGLQLKYLFPFIIATVSDRKSVV